MNNISLVKNLSMPIQNQLKNLKKLPSHIAIGVSGGIDSAMLALIANQVTREMGINLICFHINHGLHIDADEWEKQVFFLASLLKLKVYQKNIFIHKKNNYGLEAAARNERFKAFLNLANEHNIKHILLAHHQDDQAETVLMRLLRGTGLQGIRAMLPITQREGILYIRPWLEINRQYILNAGELFSKTNSWIAVNDPANFDSKYTRSIVRKELTPILNYRWPSWKKILSRHANHMAEIEEFIKEFVQLDLKKLSLNKDNRSLSLSKWRSLSYVRQVQILRYWLDFHGIYMLNHKWLKNLLRQLKQLHNFGFDRKMIVQHGNHQIFCHKNKIWIEICNKQK
ncbi:MAG: tRNA lysidine(34) synthetase TilS [Bordetella sp.]|nr:MAG: tRNA lysidine(34) synthetase TilS [Bordetella sp.]